MIRKANANDIDGLIKLLYQVHAVHSKGRPDIFKIGGIKYQKKEIEDILENPDTPVFVYLNDENNILGYAFCEIKITKESASLQGRKTLYIEDLCVDENARGQHIGSLLFEYVRNFAKEGKCDSITLNVWELNDGARKFYEKCGLKPLKTVMEQIL
ncbi:MAG: GNAT family N-acetyltransferase [Clostridia bacterium]|nr:GNAT family N-acetyltransferase [Clostridia bacterium]